MIRENRDLLERRGNIRNRTVLASKQWPTAHRHRIGCFDAVFYRWKSSV